MPSGMDAVKLLDREKGLVEGWAIPYGGPMNGRDLDGDAFTPATKLYLDAYEKRPLLYHHGMDATMGFDPIGQVTKATRKERGIWAEAQLDMANEYKDVLLALLGDEMLGFSSGAHPRSVAKTADGIITNWFWNEESLTPMPSNPYAVISAKSGRELVPVKAQMAIFKKLGRLPNPEEAEELAEEYLKPRQGIADDLKGYIDDRMEQLRTEISGLKQTPAEVVKDKELTMRQLELENMRLRQEAAWIETY